MKDPVESNLQAVSTPRAIARRRLYQHQGFIIGAIGLAIVLGMALFAPLLAPYDPYEQVLTRRLIPPFWQEDGTWLFPLGTDHLGRDYLSRILYGARVSLAIGFVATIISAVIGGTLGMAAGYFGGRVDMVVSFMLSTRLSMPVVLVALSVVALVGGSLTVVISVLGCLLWDRFTVVLRAVTMRERLLDYVSAAKAIGCTDFRIIAREIFPNVFPSFVVIATLEMANAILLEAALSFLGLGVQPPLPSWGLMIAEAKEQMYFSPWIIAIPGCALFALVLSINLFGDGLRDVLSPEGRN